MSARMPIILFVVAAVLAAYILAFERDSPGRAEIDARSGLLLEGLVRERITGMQIASGDRRVELAREGEGFDETWTIEGPRQAPADPEAIEDYLRNWEFAVPVRTLQSPTPEDSATFGMDTPKAEVTFQMGRASVRVSLGTGSPVDGGGYVRIDDHKSITVVSNDVVALFEKDVADFEIKGDAGSPDLSQLTDTVEENQDAAVAAP